MSNSGDNNENNGQELKAEEIPPGGMVQMNLPQINMVSVQDGPVPEIPKVVVLRMETALGSLIFPMLADNAQSLGKLLQENARAAKLATSGGLTVIDRSKG